MSRRHRARDYQRPGSGFTEFDLPELDLRGRGFDRPVWVSPDWPPVSETTMAIYKLMNSGASPQYIRSRLWLLTRHWY